MLAAAIITAGSTVALALLAYLQIKAAREEADNAHRHSDAALASALELTRETREAAERQWQPRVIAYAWGGPMPGTGDNVAPDEVAVGYRLKNEGTGPAFNVEHGVEVDGEPHKWQGGQYPAMAAGEEIPPMLDSIGMPVQLVPLMVGVSRQRWGGELVFWTRFENLLGERFEVRSFPDATKPAVFQRLSRLQA